MASKIPKLRDVVPPVKSFKDIGINKGLAKIGDAVTNLAYSHAKSIVTGTLSVKTVSRTILSNALRDSDMKQYAKSRSDAHGLADTAESFVGYVYCVEGWTVESMVAILVEHLRDIDLNDPFLEVHAGSEAFKHLLQKIKEALVPKLIA